MEDNFFDSDMFGGDSPDNEDISFSPMLSAINGGEANDDTDRRSDSEAPESEGSRIENAATDDSVSTAENSSAGYADEPNNTDNEYPDNAAAEQSDELSEYPEAGIDANNTADDLYVDNNISDDASDAYADDAEPTEGSIAPAEPASPKAVPLSALHRDAELSTGHGRRSKSKRGRRTAEPKKKAHPGLRDKTCARIVACGCDHCRISHPDRNICAC